MALQINDHNLGRKKGMVSKARLFSLPIAIVAGASVCALAATSSALAAQGDRLDPVSHNPPGASQVVRLFPGVAPGLEGATQVEVSDDGLRVRNVTVPEILIYKPKPGTLRTGAAMIVAPGGGGVHLSIINEGQAVAERLAAIGVTAIVLKYRTNATPAVSRPNLAPGAGARDDFAARQARPAGGAPGAGSGPGAASGGDAPGGQVRNLGRNDAVAAMRYVRTHAAELGISPDRIGMVGFSAGGSLAMYLAVSTDPAIRPDFVGAIYSPGPPGPVPANAPPLFLAVANDDQRNSAESLKTAEAWRQAKLPVELHLFNSGAHGFGTTQQDKTSDHWLEEFIWWLIAPNGQIKLATR